MRRRVTTAVGALLIGLGITLIGAAPTSAQESAVGAVFRILENGTQIGVASSAVMPEADGFMVRGTSFIGGNYRLTVKRFEGHYDAAWRGLSATVELATPAESLVVHSSVNGGDARTDILHDGRIDIGRQPLSTDTIFIPDMVFSAHEALARRLATARVGAQLPVFLMPLAEIKVRVDGSRLEQVASSGGPVAARRWSLAFITNTRETVAELWEAQGRLLRVDMPTSGISVIRSDVTP